MIKRLAVFLPRALRPIRRAARRAQHGLEHRLVRLTADPRPGLSRRVETAAVSRARLLLLAGLEGASGEAQFWQGAERTTGEPMRVAFAGDRRALVSHSAEYLRHLLFRPAKGSDSHPGVSAAAHEVSILHPPLLDLARGADLVIMERSRLLPAHPPAAGAWFAAPTWVRMGIIFQLDEPWEAVQERMASHKNNIRRFQKVGFKFWTSTSEADFHTFYDRMHLPMITGRHGDYSDVEPKEAMLDSFRKNGLLIFANTPEGQTVAGKLLYHYPAEKLAYVISAGTLDGERQWHDLGALSALTWQEIRWGWEQGLHVLDGGSVRPFASDGNYLFKLRWGMTPIPDPWAARTWLFWVPDVTTPGGAAALRWMQAHPLIGIPSAQSHLPVTTPAMHPSPVPVTGQEREQGDREA